MKKTKKTKSQDSSQTAYMEILKSLRNAISADYSYAIPKEKRAVILAYDWVFHPAKKLMCFTIPAINSSGTGKAVHFSEVFEKTKAESALAWEIFHSKEGTIRALKQHMRVIGIETR